MKRVMIVDDDPQTLGELQAGLRRRRVQWDVSYLENGVAALEVLARQRCDVILANLRMPGMDGATLLRNVQERHPATIRIILTSPAEQEIALRTVSVAHQYLLRPCRPDVVESVVERSCALRTLIGDEVIRSLVGGVQDLPTLPRIYLELNRALEDQNAGVRDMAALIQQDQAMSAKVLQLVNSAFLGLRRELTSIEQAVGFLGTTMLKSLTLAVHVFGADRLDPDQLLWLERVQRHALLVGSLARQVVGDNPVLAEDAFAAGMLHDVGKLVLRKHRAELATRLALQAAAESRTIHEIELEAMGVTHAEIGGYLLGIWGLPFTIVEAVANHHRPHRVAAHGTIDAVGAVYVANILAHEQEREHGVGEPGEHVFDPAYLNAIGAGNLLDDWRAAAAEKAAQAGRTNAA